MSVLTHALPNVQKIFLKLKSQTLVRKAFHNPAEFLWGPYLLIHYVFIWFVSLIKEWNLSVSSAQYSILDRWMLNKQFAEYMNE